VNEWMCVAVYARMYEGVHTCVLIALYNINLTEPRDLNC